MNSVLTRGLMASVRKKPEFWNQFHLVRISCMCGNVIIRESLRCFALIAAWSAVAVTWQHTRAGVMEPCPL